MPITNMGNKVPTCKCAAENIAELTTAPRNPPIRGTSAASKNPRKNTSSPNGASKPTIANVGTRAKPSNAPISSSFWSGTRMSIPSPSISSAYTPIVVRPIESATSGSHKADHSEVRRNPRNDTLTLCRRTPKTHEPASSAIGSKMLPSIIASILSSTSDIRASAKPNPRLPPTPAGTNSADATMTSLNFQGTALILLANSPEPSGSSLLAGNAPQVSCGSDSHSEQRSSTPRSSPSFPSTTHRRKGHPDARAMRSQRILPWKTASARHRRDRDTHSHRPLAGTAC